GLPNMALGVVFDCGLPAATVMRNDLAKAFPLWKSVMDELAKIPLVGKLFEYAEPSIELMDWTPKNTNTVIAGGVGGLTTRTITNTMKTFSGLSKNNRAGITSWATKTFTSDMKTAAEKAFVAANPNLAGTPELTQLVDNYGSTFEESFGKNLKSGFDDALTKTKLRENALIGDFKNVKNSDLTDAIAKARASSDSGLDAFLKGQSGLKATDLAGNSHDLTWFDVLAENGTSGPGSYNPRLRPKDLVGKLKGELGKSVTSKTHIAGVKAKVTSQLDGSTAVIKKFKDGGVQVYNSIPNASIQSEAKQIANEILTEQVAAGGGTVTGAQINSAADTISLNVKNSMGGKSITKTDFISKVTDETENALRTNPKLARIADAQLDDFAKASKGMVDEALTIKDPTAFVGKRGFFTKAKALFSGRFIASIGRGIGCGLASNYVGVKKYKEAVAGHLKNEVDQVKSLGGEGTMFVKGETYKMLLKKDLGGKIKASYTPVISGSDTEKEMLSDLIKDSEGNTRGTYLKWDSKLNAQPPEKRKLVSYLLNIEITDLIEYAENNNGYTNKDKLKEIEAELQKAQVQQVIHMYTNKSESTRQKLEYKGKDFFVPEPWVGSLVVALRNELSEDMLALELKGESAFIKNKITELTSAMQASGSFILTEAIATKVVPNNAEEFFKINATWEKLVGFEGDKIA
ncbi:MAG: hypothetical protein HOC95_02140, partial [Candidatus Diapherotrites archaeon]|nr:hypothetical protein [Candidatus Diapherotrites archaeon]